MGVNFDASQRTRGEHENRSQGRRVVQEVFNRTHSTANYVGTERKSKLPIRHQKRETFSVIGLERKKDEASLLGFLGRK